MCVDCWATETLRPPLRVALGMRHEAVGLAGVERLTPASLLGGSHSSGGRLERAVGLGEGTGVEAAVDPDGACLRARPDDALGLVQIHRHRDVSVAERAGELAALGGGVATVDEEVIERWQGVDDVQAGSGAITDSWSQREARHHLRDGFGPDAGGVGGQVGFVAEEVLGGAAVGRGAVAPAGLVVGGPETTSVGINALLVRPGVALDVGAVDGHCRRSLERRREAGLDEQCRELVQADLLERAAFRAREDFAGVRIDVEVVVVIDQDTVRDDAFDGPPAGVHPLVPDLHALRDPERRSLLRLELLD